MSACSVLWSQHLAHMSALHTCLVSQVCRADMPCVQPVCQRPWRVEIFRRSSVGRLIILPRLIAQIAVLDSCDVRSPNDWESQKRCDSVRTLQDTPFLCLWIDFTSCFSVCRVQPWPQGGFVRYRRSSAEGVVALLLWEKCQL